MSAEVKPRQQKRRQRVEGGLNDNEMRSIVTGLLLGISGRSRPRDKLHGRTKTSAPPAVVVPTRDLNLLNVSGAEPVFNIFAAVVKSRGSYQMIENIPEIFRERIARDRAEVFGIGQAALQRQPAGILVRRPIESF